MSNNQPGSSAGYATEAEQAGPALSGIEVGSPGVPGLNVRDESALLDDVTRDLDGVEAALHRLDAGSYGRCEACGVAIEPLYLQDDPLVDLCIDHR